MPWHIGKYLADTMHLTTEQHGAYLLLLAAGWMRHGQLPSDDAQLAAIARLPLKRWLAMRPVISAFFTVSPDGWSQKRQIEELGKAIALTNARSEAGKKGGRPKATDKQTESPALAEHKLNETPLPLPLQSRSKETSTSESNDSDSGDAARSAFIGQIIRLNRGDLDHWQKTYHAIPDIVAELTTLDAYYDQELQGKDRKNWFIRCSSALGKKHQTLMAEAKNKTGGLYGGAMFG